MRRVRSQIMPPGRKRRGMRDITFNVATIRAEVREWLKANGWVENIRHWHKTIDGERWRMFMGVNNLKEQRWRDRPYTHGVKGLFATVRSAPWSAVKIENGVLVFEKNEAGVMRNRKRAAE